MSDAQAPHDPTGAENHEITAAEAEEKNVDPVDATTEADVSDGREQKRAPVEGS